MKLAIKSNLIILILWLSCCASDGTHSEEEAMSNKVSVIEVGITGEENTYTFSVTLRSPDTGCEQYANWWEVIDLEGNLLYRRILAHSHVNEQPFTRSGGTINITSETVVYVRAHMNNLGYGSTALKGSVTSGFSKAELKTDFAIALETQEPLPNECAF
ncbi:MAG: hypothetical protein WBB27_08190 [Maribacter sp.]